MSYSNYRSTSYHITSACDGSILSILVWKWSWAEYKHCEHIVWYNCFFNTTLFLYIYVRIILVGTLQALGLNAAFLTKWCTSTSTRTCSDYLKLTILISHAIKFQALCWILVVFYVHLIWQVILGYCEIVDSKSRFYQH